MIKQNVLAPEWPSQAPQPVQERQAFEGPHQQFEPAYSCRPFFAPDYPQSHQTFHSEDPPHRSETRARKHVTTRHSWKRWPSKAQDGLSPWTVNVDGNGNGQNARRIGFSSPTAADPTLRSTGQGAVSEIARTLGYAAAAGSR